MLMWLKFDLLHFNIIGLNLSLRILHSERVEALGKCAVILSFDFFCLSLAVLVCTKTSGKGCQLETQSLLTRVDLRFDNLGCQVTYLAMFDR